MGLFRSIGARKDATRGTAAIEVRKGFANLFSGAGVLPGATSPLVTGTAAWTYSVGVAGFVSTRGASDGVHLFGNDGAVTIGATGVGSTVPVAPGAGLQRIDIIWVTQPSASENSDTISDPSFGVTSGTAASTALPPTIPAGALELARNLMTSAATTTSSTGNSITQTAQQATLRTLPSLSGKVTSNIAGIVTATPIATSAPVLGTGTRRFKITGSVYSVQSTVPGDVFNVKVVDSTTSGVIQQIRVTTPASGFSDGVAIVASDVPTVGAHTYQLVCERATGTGSGTALAGATDPIEIIVEMIAW